MIYELASIKIDPAKSNEFEAAVKSAAPLFKSSKGCIAMNLQKIIENDGEYLLQVTWESLEAHIVDFRNSQNFQDWRALAGPFFIEPPKVIHSNVVGNFF